MMVTSDPTLAALVPATSRRRVVGALAAGLALLVGAWFSVDAVRPSAVPSSGSGTWTGNPVRLQVTTVGDLVGATWAGVEVLGVRDVAGATAVGAWLLPVAHEGGVPVLPDDALGAVTDAGALPQRLAHGEHAWLVVTWQVTSCDELVADEHAVLELAGPFGVRRTEPLPDYLAPGWGSDLSPADEVCG